MFPENSLFGSDNDIEDDDLDIYIKDNRNEIEYLKQMVYDINQLPIRRLDIHFRSINTHGSYIKKYIILTNPGDKFIQLLISIIERDISHNNNMYEMSQGPN